MSKQDVYAAQSAYESALASYEAFRATNQDVLEEHDFLVVQLTDSLEQYKNAMRENAAIMGKNIGSFSISIPKTYDATALRKLLGSKADPYLETKYSVNSREFEDAVNRGLVDRAIADQVIGRGSPRITGGPRIPTVYQR